MRFFADRMKIVVEPTGCLAFAAARAGGTALAGRRVGVIISGGNVSMSRMTALLTSGA
jgi:threonine dehydratase